jgi:hypothetical protein
VPRYATAEATGTICRDDRVRLPGTRRPMLAPTAGLDGCEHALAALPDVFWVDLEYFQRSDVA